MPVFRASRVFSSRRYDHRLGLPPRQAAASSAHRFPRSHWSLLTTLDSDWLEPGQTCAPSLGRDETAVVARQAASGSTT